MNNPNVNPEEIAKFSKLASDWWNPNGSMKLLHALNPLRLGYLQQFVNPNAKSILDVGCGAGILTESLARLADKTTGIDLSCAALQSAREHALEQGLNITYEEITVEDFSANHPGQFDIVTCMEMLEHVPDPSSVIHACAKLLKPGGFAFFSTIHRTPKAYLFAILGAEYLLKALPKGTHHYQQFIRPSELNTWAEAAQLSLRHISGIHYSPFKQSFSLSRDLAVNYITCYQAGPLS